MIDKLMLDNVSLVTSFNKRIFETDDQKIFHDVKEKYPEVEFYVYHENSFEKRNHNVEIDFTGEERDTLNLLDLFEVYEDDWLYDFLQTSPFSTCHEIGRPGCSPDGLSNEYWNRNSIYWFRKVAAINHCVDVTTKPYLVWVGADTQFREDKDHPNGFDKLFFDYVSNFDSSVITRPEKAIDAEIMVFNLEKNGKDVVKKWFEYYTSLRAFDEFRWDDGYILTLLVDQLKKEGYTFGSLRHGFDQNVYRYVRHFKGPLLKVRDMERGI